MERLTFKTKGIVLLLFFNLLFPDLFAQNLCQSDRYTNPAFFSEGQLKTETHLSYGTAVDWLGVPDTQRIYIVYPDLNSDALKQRPFIMLMHGGGFAPEDEYSNKEQWISLCRLLAKRGFVAATIDYRVGWMDRKKTWPEYTAEERKNPTGIFAIYRAYQDARAALRYFVHNASLFGIDTNNIFIGGRSAGGDLSMATAFYSQHDVDSVLKTVIPMDCHKIFGSLDSATNIYPDHFKIRGVANMWGPIYDTTMISDKEARCIPIIMFHGTDDRSVVYKKNDTSNYPFVTYGSVYVAERYKHLGGCYQLNTKLGGGHGEDFSDEFMAEHISAFFKNAMCNQCKSEEFESDVSFGWKANLFFESDAWINLIPVAVLVIIIILLVRYIRRKREIKKIA